MYLLADAWLEVPDLLVELFGILLPILGLLILAAVTLILGVEGVERVIVVWRKRGRVALDRIVSELDSPLDPAIIVLSWLGGQLTHKNVDADYLSKTLPKLLRQLASGLEGGATTYEEVVKLIRRIKESVD